MEFPSNDRMPLDLRMGQIRETERDEQVAAARTLLDSENGNFHIKGEPTVTFGVRDLEMRTGIGRGQFAEVVKRAVYTPRGMDVAVKIIYIIDRPSGNNDGRGNEEMIREAENARRAAHHNVVWLYGFVVEQQICYMCMELMQANLEEVKKVMHDQAGLNIEKKSENRDIESFLGCVTVAVVDGLAFLRNNARVMHRDIKPNNIMINDRGQVKICDFGVSKKLHTGISNSRAHTTTAGCISYMAPEQFSVDVATSGYGSKAGVWSLGISLFECALGRYAFDGQSDFVIAGNIQTKDPPRIPMQAGFSQDLRNFVDACLFKYEPDRSSLVPTDGNCLQNKKFYKEHVRRGDDARSITVVDVLSLATPHLPMLRRSLLDR